jgi:hypothetical protein
MSPTNIQGSQLAYKSSARRQPFFDAVCSAEEVSNGLEYNLIVRGHAATDEQYQPSPMIALP